MSATFAQRRTSIHSQAASLAKPGLAKLLADAEKYPRSYGRERIMEEADAILDYALDMARKVASLPAPMCVVCDGLGCEFCAKV